MTTDRPSMLHPAFLGLGFLTLLLLATLLYVPVADCAYCVGVGGVTAEELNAVAGGIFWSSSPPPSPGEYVYTCHPCSTRGRVTILQRQAQERDRQDPATRHIGMMSEEDLRRVLDLR